jgi:hypothetical protein
VPGELLTTANISLRRHNAADRPSHLCIVFPGSSGRSRPNFSWGGHPCAYHFGRFQRGPPKMGRAKRLASAKTCRWCASNRLSLKPPTVYFSPRFGSGSVGYCRTSASIIPSCAS